MIDGLNVALEMVSDRISSIGNEGPLWRELCDLKRDLMHKLDEEMEDMATAMGGNDAEG